MTANTVALVWFVGCLILFFGYSLYIEYTDDYRGDFDWVIIILWPVTLSALVAIIIPIKTAIFLGENIGRRLRKGVS